MRTCGTCTVCCTVGAVEELNKPPKTPCVHLGDLGGCRIYGKPERPAVCSGFHCSWIEGIGRKAERPDRCGVLLSVNEMNGGTWGFVVELEPNAARTTGKRVIMELAEKLPFPVIVSRYESEPPHDTGDLAVIKEPLLQRSGQMIGASLGHLDEVTQRYGIYELVSG